jgi:F420H(2)-dependent quinone reductase
MPDEGSPHAERTHVETEGSTALGSSAPPGRSTGRRTGRERSAILAYLEDGPNLFTLAMNGWADGEPAWWLNLQAHPDAVVTLVDGTHPVRGRAAEGDERARLWAKWREVDPDLDAYAALRSSETALVVLERG